MTDQEVLRYHLLATELLLIFGKMGMGMAEYLIESDRVSADPDSTDEDWLDVTRRWAHSLSDEDKEVLDELATETTPLQRARASLKAMEENAMADSLTDKQRKDMMATRARQMEYIIRLSEAEGDE